MYIDKLLEQINQMLSESDLKVIQEFNKDKDKFKDKPKDLDLEELKRERAERQQAERQRNDQERVARIKQERAEKASREKQELKKQAQRNAEILDKARQEREKKELELYSSLRDVNKKVKRGRPKKEKKVKKKKTNGGRGRPQKDQSEYDNKLKEVVGSNLYGDLVNSPKARRILNKHVKGVYKRTMKNKLNESLEELFNILGVTEKKQGLNEDNLGKLIGRYNSGKLQSSNTNLPSPSSKLERDREIIKGLQKDKDSKAKNQKTSKNVVKKIDPETGKKVITVKKKINPTTPYKEYIKGEQSKLSSEQQATIKKKGAAKPFTPKITSGGEPPTKANRKNRVGNKKRKQQENKNINILSKPVNRNKGTLGEELIELLEVLQINESKDIEDSLNNIDNYEKNTKKKKLKKEIKRINDDIKKESKKSNIKESIDEVLSLLGICENKTEKDKLKMYNNTLRSLDDNQPETGMPGKVYKRLFYKASKVKNGIGESIDEVLSLLDICEADKREFRQDGTGPHGQGKGPGQGKADGSGLKDPVDKETEKVEEEPKKEKEEKKESSKEQEEASKPKIKELKRVLDSIKDGKASIEELEEILGDKKESEKK